MKSLNNSLGKYRNVLRNLFALVLILLITASCGYRQKKDAPANDFKTIVRLKTTPVKDQGKSNLCWIYAMLATIESQHLMLGDSIHLSTSYIARKMIEEKAVEYFFSQDSKTMKMRGMGPMLIHYLEKYGAEPYDSYEDAKDLNYIVLERKIMHLADQVSANGRGLEHFKKKLEDGLDDEMGYMPSRFVHMLGSEYTPLEFAHSVAAPGEYQFFTSFTHHPFGQYFKLETPDNEMGDLFYNVSMKDMMHFIEECLKHGKPVFWEGDTSEDGFSFQNGIATLPSGTKVDQATRQKQFESRKTTDDHAMALVGIAKDKKGQKYFIAKNSWGTDNPYQGFMYLSYEYVAMKTICIGFSGPKPPVFKADNPLVSE